MKKVVKIAALVAVLVIAIAVAAFAFLLMRKPAQRPPSAERIEVTPERLERGRYLVNHVSICFDCHSERTAGFGFPFVPEREGAGGFVWNEEIGFPGVVGASNITGHPETGLGNWTDGEILRALREGVNREGQALFPIMPYEQFRQMSDEDAKSIVAYLRTLRPISYTPPAKSLKPPLNIIEKFIPKPLEGEVSAPDPGDTVARGRYLVTIGVCGDCHTPKDDKGNSLPGQELAGGYEMHGPGFTVVPTKTGTIAAVSVGGRIASSHARSEPGAGSGGRIESAGRSFDLFMR